MPQVDKVIVSHRGALLEKYAAPGLLRIERAVARLVRADGRRGLRSKVVYLDSAEHMRAIGPRVRSRTALRQHKVAIDSVFRAYKPDYLMILGAPDVIPHQRLRNPMAASRDSDRSVPSDLPYACEQPFGTEIRKFLGPTRVVGRLPDITGEGDTDYLVGLLNAASSWRRRRRTAYRKFFALSAENWRDSTRTSIAKLFGGRRGVHLSPDEGPAWTGAELAGRIHFINCHGDRRTPEFFGEDDDNENEQPTAHESTAIAGSVRRGTVVAAECCYGAELYAPEVDGPRAICNTYLGAGALGFFGSTTTAWGPDAGNNFCDLMCIEFVRSVLEGASLGRAALRAQQHYVTIGGYMEMIDLKTIAQFLLLGDPSLHAVRPIGGAPASARKARGTRRARLRIKGRRIGSGTASVESQPDARATALARRRLRAELARLGARQVGRIASFRLHAPEVAVKARRGRAMLAKGTVFHAVALRPAGGGKPRVLPQRLLLMHEVGGRIPKVVKVIRHGTRPTRR